MLKAIPKVIPNDRLFKALFTRGHCVQVRNGNLYLVPEQPMGWLHRNTLDRNIVSPIRVRTNVIQFPVTKK